jgi:hypothetical protein
MSRKKLKAGRRARRREAEAPAKRPAQDWSPRPADPAGEVRPSITDDKRSLDRISQRELGKVEIAFRAPGRDWTPVRLWDFSSVGFGVLLETAATAEDPILGRTGAGHAGRQPMVRPGDEVDVRVKVGSHARHETRCRVMNLSDWRGSQKIGLKRLDLSAPGSVDEERRSSRRLALLPLLSLKARIRHPFIYGQWSMVTVADLNRHLGFSFQSSDPSILLFTGMELRIHFELASFRSLPITGRVTWVHAAPEGGIRFGIECLSMDWRLQNGICDYLLFARNWTPSMLRASGFRSQQVREHLRFRTVKTMEDYADVLRLRRDAYVSAGKRPESTTAEEMATPLDGISRILMARHHGQLVGSLTFTFPVTEDTLLDSQAGFPGRKYPVPIPPKANLIEVSRLCIHQEYRGTDLLQGMFESGLKHFLMSDRHWLITSATADLVPTYRAIGFVGLKASYRHHMLNNKEHHLLIAHRSAFLWGFGIGLLTWNSVFGDLVKYLMDQKLIAVPGWMRAIIRAKLLFRPLARAFSDSRSRLAFHKHLEAIKKRAAAREA